MNSLANSTLSVKHSGTQFISGTSAQRNEFLGSSSVLFLPCSQKNLKSLKCRRSLTVQASGDGRPGSASIFVGGFVLGGLVVGALGCIYAPQISKALAGTDRKEIMRKLPKFIYDEEKALEVSASFFNLSRTHVSNAAIFCMVILLYTLLSFAI
ncbi:OLC1v1010471C2 [Oldenlandia corymbosa var. corymbosa]|uniref:OLC1v1010471C2 n=1 Tax=Oldenlandia corymbosa var. corymbosa TaxID=529605 RepID=A0AAV1DUN4_OLDCO|nr:OLC1v1010471C2 [Oldenlandia corymbosa var. corymbosa]